MKRRVIIKLSLTLLFCLKSIAQDNVFLSRDYWKSKPSISQIQKDIKAGNDASELNTNAFDAVVYALLEKVDNKTVKFLLSQDGNGVNKKTHDGRTYIFWASYKDNLEMMQFLVSKGAKTNIIDSHGYSLLNFTAVTGQQNTKLYDFCIANGANPKTEKNNDGANALLLVAPFLTDTKLLDYFTAKGVSFNSTDTNGNGIFNYASKNGNIEIMKKLISLGALFNAPTNDGTNAIILASKGTRRSINSLETFKYLESLGISPNTTTKKGITPLHALSFKNKDLSIFEYFIEKGVNINQQDEDGNTAFMNAIYRNDLKTITFLHKYITDINTVNKEGKSPLMIAVSRNRVDVVNFLLENGANINLKDTKENTLSHYLLESFKSEDQDDFNTKTKVLTDLGLKIAETQANGNSLYHLAVKKNNLELIKRLKPFNIPVNTKNNEGMTPLHIAGMKAENTGILKYLLEIGADKTIKTDFNETVFDLAIENELLNKKDLKLNFLK